MDEIKKLIVQNKQYYKLIQNLKDELQNIYAVEDIIDTNILILENEIIEGKKMIDENCSYLKKTCNNFYS